MTRPVKKNPPGPVRLSPPRCIMKHLVMRLSMKFVIALVLWSANACAPAHQDTRTAPMAALPTTQLRVQVINQHPAPVSVSLFDSGLKVRLGMVLSMGSEVFHVRGSVVSHDRELRLIVEPVAASEVYVSDVIRVAPGQHVRLQVGSHVLLSQHFVQ
jgi:hypothetical protein